MKSITFAVSEEGSQARAGDYFTAIELALACLNNNNWTSYFSVRNTDWHKPVSTDFLMALLDDYQVDKISHSSQSPVKIAWARNWFDKWVLNSAFGKYDILLSSSMPGVEYFKARSSKPCYFFPLATNIERFSAGTYRTELVCDYCFTGSYWHSKRLICEWLKPMRIDYSFAVYGHGWSWPRSFWRWTRGFVSYENIPDVYASTKLVVDDANETTGLWASVNSRVFDALGAGRLVITNGTGGAKELFGNRLPVYRNAKQLHEMIKYYLTNDAERDELAKELQLIVKMNHTYLIRANKLKQILIK